MDDNVQQPQSANPLLTRIKLPGETFTLPSGGLFYDEGVLDPSVDNAEVHVHPMTALDEIEMKTPDLLFSGKAAESVFKRCIPEVLDIKKMLSKDVDFLLACLRKVSYGDTMRIEHQHNCEGAKMHSYTVNIAGFLKKSKRIDPTTLEKNFSVTLPNNQVVKMKPVTFGQFIHMMQILTASDDDEATPEIVRDEMVRSLVDLIVQVDEVKDPKLITEWLTQIPAGYIEKINSITEKNTGWGINFDTSVKCIDCGKKMEISASVNPIAFFT